MWNDRLDEVQAGIKIAGRNINNLRHADDTTLMAESEEELQKPLDGSESGEWKSWIKNSTLINEDHGIQSHHFMANRWGNDGNSDRVYFYWASKSLDGNCSHEIKRCSLKEKPWQI